MKKVVIGTLAILLLGCILYYGCLIYDAYPYLSGSWAGYSCRLSVMVDGVRYVTFSREVSLAKEPEIAGYIQSQSVSVTEIPWEDNTSNFSACVGQPYAFLDGELILYYNNQWNICYLASERPLN